MYHIMQAVQAVQVAENGRKVEEDGSYSGLSAPYATTPVKDSFRRAKVCLSHAPCDNVNTKLVFVRCVIL